MNTQKSKLTYKDEVLLSLARIESAIRGVGGISQTLESLYDKWKHPVMTIAEEMQPEWDRQEESNRAEKQLRIIERQNIILIITILINAIVSIFAILVQAGVIKIKQ